MALNLTVIFGSVRSVRRGIRAVRYLERAFAALKAQRENGVPY
jgi:hypothetical protein